jgi:competence protein ComEC
MHRFGSVWSASPALIVAIALAVGIWWSDVHAEHAWPGSFVIIVAGIMVTTRLIRGPSGVTVLLPLSRFAVAILLLICGGSMRNRFARQGESAWASIYRATEDRELMLEGRVVEMRKSRSGARRFVLEDVRVQTGRRVPGRVIVYPSSQHPSPGSGARVMISGRVATLPDARNPGEFDYGVYLRRRAIHGRLFMDEGGTFRQLGPAPGFMRATASVRAFVEAKLITHIPSDASRSVLVAMVLGDRSGIDPVMQEAFVATGLVHLLAVSGLHVMIVGLTFYRLCRPALLRLGMPWRIAESLRSAATLGLLVVYAMITGLPASVVRAVTMTAALLLGPVMRRRSQSLNSLGVAAAAILWVQPYSLFDPGFQLSVSAVSGIILMVPPLKTTLARRFSARVTEGPVCSSLLVSLSATASTLPVLMAHFGRASLAGIPLNVAAIPLAAAALSSVVLCLMATPMPLIASAFGASADLCMRLLARLASSGSQLLSPLDIDTTSGVVGHVGVVTLIVILLSLHQPARTRRTFAVGIILIALLRLRPIVEKPTLDVLFFDVGQGDATLIKTPLGAYVLVDAGPRNDHLDTAARVILPFLSRNRIGHIDILLLTHAHADHIGGASSILRTIDVGRLVYTGIRHSSTMMKGVLNVADSVGVPRHQIAAGDSLQLDASVRMYIPGPSSSLLATASENNRSAVGIVTFGQTSLLLMGDAEELAEADLLERYETILTANVVKVGHHGSATSSRQDLVSAVTRFPVEKSWAVVSVGRRNSYGLPSRRVLDRWKSAGMETLSTATNGAVLVRSDGASFERVQWRTPP